jgi:hypothetical protein
VITHLQQERAEALRFRAESSIVGDSWLAGGILSVTLGSFLLG